MKFTAESIRQLLLEQYRLDTHVESLPGELDLNFKCTGGQRTYIFKVANADERLDQLELQHAVIAHLNKQRGELQISEVVPAVDGATILTLSDEAGRTRFARLLTWVEGRVLASVNPHTTQLMFRLGELCGRLCAMLKGFDHPAAHRTLKWDPSGAAWVEPYLEQFDGQRQHIARRFFRLFSEEALPLLPRLRMSVNYNDANDYNVLVGLDPADPRVPGVIDFGDVAWTHTVNELAIALAYAMMHKTDPVATAVEVVRGFHQQFALTEDELHALYPLTVARLLISVTCARQNQLQHPDNIYLQISDEPAWQLLSRLQELSPRWIESRFRHACGMPVVKQAPLFEEWARSISKRIWPVAMPETAATLDLSVGSLELGVSAHLADSEKLDRAIRKMMGGSLYAFGRYDEARAIYATDAYQVVGNDGAEWRTVHIGLDLFAPAGTPVVAACDGEIFSVANNAAERDYGPTIILRHQPVDGLVFYTLYGHLSLDSLEGRQRGDVVKAGAEIGAVGDRSVNGNWTPHLHFQVMLDMLDKEGDFPGVCVPSQRDVWKALCPDPFWLLQGEPMDIKRGMSNDEIVAFRKQFVGKNLSISYRKPIRMVRGDGAWLIDDEGRRYLDTVNNVAQVGHEHPAVVTAGQRQMAVLNTNTRYLHENMVHFVEALLKTLPPKLNVVYLVNSGSEANELAMRLAKTYTNQRDMVVSEVGYHGNTNGCVEVSSYKFDGPGGKGAAPHVHVVPIPDTYRGIYRAGDHQPGQQYASHVQEAIQKIQQQGRNVAALMFESVISCGGQVVLPEGFLAAAYTHTRAAGGVCIADEVQTGCGRAGAHFWAFEAHGVIPDIVTIGKPIGNGHPLGVVVTTQEIGEAFRNGMEYFNTFGGNPVSCAIGTAVLRVIDEEGLQRKALETGNFLTEGLQDLMTRYEIIGDVRGPGLFLGFELVTSRDSREPATAQTSWLANRMRDKGILMSVDGPYNNVLKIKPPLVFGIPEASLLLEQVERVLREDYMKV
ncbi:MAG: aminotransferase class III-fold pyridoxal phosphate-dependent enzyme [Cyclobacteriaceae bacterium]